MRANDFINEASWKNLDYTELELFRLRQVLKGIALSYQRHGIDLTISAHVLDQVKLDRGVGEKFTPNDFIQTFTKLAPRLKRLFQRDPEIAHLVVDRRNLVHLMISQPLPGKYIVSTVLRDTEWYGTTVHVQDYL